MDLFKRKLEKPDTHDTVKPADLQRAGELLLELHSRNSAIARYDELIELDTDVSIRAARILAAKIKEADELKVWTITKTEYIENDQVVPFENIEAVLASAGLAEYDNHNYNVPEGLLCLFNLPTALSFYQLYSLVAFKTQAFWLVAPPSFSNQGRVIALSLDIDVNPRLFNQNGRLDDLPMSWHFCQATGNVVYMHGDIKIQVNAAIWLLYANLFHQKLIRQQFYVADSSFHRAITVYNGYGNYGTYTFHYLLRSPATYFPLLDIANARIVKIGDGSSINDHRDADFTQIIAQYGHNEKFWRFKDTQLINEMMSINLNPREVVQRGKGTSECYLAIEESRIQDYDDLVAELTTGTIKDSHHLTGINNQWLRIKI